MTGPRLSADEVRAGAPDGWRQILGRVKARYRTGDLATGLALVERVGALVVAAQGRPELTLTTADLVVALSTPDAGGVTAADLDLAARIGAAAADLGVVADPGGLTQLELGLDTAAGERLAPFYAALLGSRLEHGEPVDRTGQVPTVWWQEPAGADGGDDDGPPLPGQGFEQRWHADVWVAHDEAPRRVQAVLAAGGRLVSDAAAPAYWVVEDADGNRACLCTPAGR